ncbi:MAG: alpha/beta hydrolase [Gemmatimonadaceae bacterium]|nr:alpha/beta hydrolase [Gemmatimonadaceae bacterium]
MRLALATLSILVLLGYGGASAYLVLNERELVFHPAERAVHAPPAEFALRERRVSYPSVDGTRLQAWVMPGALPDSVGYWLLICHGNYGNIGYGDRPAFYAGARDLGLNLLAFDYRGFGESEGSPEEQGLYADAEASYRYLTDSLRVPPDRIVIFGHSLGSGVAIELATRVPSAALVVEGAYTSVVDRGQELYPWLPVRYIASQRFASIDKIGKVSAPKLFLHSPTDDVIPIDHGRRLFEAAREPRKFVPVIGGHMEAFKQDRGTYYGAIRALVDSLASTSYAAKS